MSSVVKLSGIWCCLLILILATEAHAASLSSVYYRLYNYFDSAEDRPQLDQALVRSIRDKVRTMQDVTDRFPATTIPKEYVDALSFDAQLLESTFGEDDAENQKKLEIVRDDLELKLRFESAVSGARDSFRGKISIAVRTRRADQDVSGLRIAANPLRWANAAPMFPIGVSSPAKGSLPPGIYELIVTAPNGEVTTRQNASVGLNGSDSEEIIVVLP